MGGSSSKAKETVFPPSRQVITSYGPIEGRRLIHEGEKQVDGFQGVPYAAPPIGNLRFALPQPHEPWTDVRSCKAFGHRGIQKDHFFMPKPGTPSEDSLTLNIFTPVWLPKNDDGFPVLFYIHGGGFVSDSAIKYGDLSISQYLVTKDVIVVTIQYRLGFLGFWTTGDDTIPDNLALHDMTFALKWIKENIKKFNGDPNNITLMGQSAGGASVDFLSVSPLSRDLFHKVIPMGGNGSCSWATHPSPLKACRKRAAEIGVADEIDSKQWIEKLRNVAAEKFAAALEIPTDPDAIVLTIGPKYDRTFLPKPLMELRKESSTKPRLVGCAKSEGLISGLFGLNLKTPIVAIREEVARVLPEDLVPLEARHHQNQIIERLIDIGTEHSKEEWSRAICEIRGDAFLNVGVQKNILDVLETRPDTPIYFYSFDYFNPKAYGILGWKLPFKDATHCTDISYVVGNHIVMPLEWNENDLKMIEITTRLWTNFVKYGDPNGETEEEREVLNGVTWQPATVQNPQINLSLDLVPQLHDQYKLGRPLYIAELMKKVKQEPIF